MFGSILPTAGMWLASPTPRDHRSSCGGSSSSHYYNGVEVRIVRVGSQERQSARRTSGRNSSDPRARLKHLRKVCRERSTSSIPNRHVALDQREGKTRQGTLTNETQKLISPHRKRWCPFFPRSANWKT